MEVRLSSSDATVFFIKILKVFTQTLIELTQTFTQALGELFRQALDTLFAETLDERFRQTLDELFRKK